jgi:hypothetical protein
MIVCYDQIKMYETDQCLENHKIVILNLHTKISPPAEMVIGHIGGIRAGRK